MQMNRHSNFKTANFAVQVLVVCVLLAAILLTLKNSRKSSFNDSDLTFSRLEVPVESNAFWTLLKATNQVYWPHSLETKLDDLSDNTNWDDSLASDILKTNQACLDLFDESLQQPFLLVPEPKTYADDDSYLGGWRAISRIASIRANALFHAKRDKEAFAAALKIIQFGHRAENSGGAIIHYLTGSSIKSFGLQRIRQMTAQTTLTEAELKPLIFELESFKPKGEGFTNAVKAEYKTECNLCDDFAAGKIPAETNANPQLTSIGIKPLFSATKTKMKFAQADRVLLNSFPKPFSDISWTDLPVVGTNVPVWKRMITGNAIGGFLFELMKPSVKSFASTKSREDVNVRATQLLLALKIYSLRHDKFPESLSELVPEFFPQAPMDDFDGKPFRYLPDKKLIYSVGPDFKDSGGEGSRKNSKDYDLPFKIEF